ncbi:MAG: phosphatase PAP2 family protein [Firmicutes bacterium]|nr:phosphatase PAP2 family protein [Bacillota bacterium]
MIESVSFFYDWEVALQIFIQSLLGSFGTTVCSAITMFGEEMIMIVILGYIYWCLDKEYGKFIGVNVIIGIVLNPLLKNIALRRRPYFDHPEIKCLKPVDASADIYDIAAQGYSFPSGHSLNSAIVYGSLPAWQPEDGRNKGWQKALMVIAIVMPLLVGVSRVALGVHYATDVLAGWAGGLVIVLGMGHLQKKVKKKWLLHLIIFLISLVGYFYCKTTDYYTGVGMMGGFFLAYHFEEKYVKFESTRNVWISILRVAVGGALYFGLNTALKLPFSKEFLDSATLAAYIVRSLRYAVVMFLLMGVYPLVFGKLFKKKAPTESEKNS